MPRDTRLVRLAAAATLMAAWGCLEGPFDASASFFPDISPTALRQNCIRGAILAPAQIQGTITTRDCHAGPGLGYLDAYRVRVSDTLDATFEMRAPEGVAPPTLDSELDLFRVADIDDYTASKVLLAHDDDSGGGPGAVLHYRLLPFSEYLIVVKGKDDVSVGDYKLSVGRVTPDQNGIPTRT
jgi:hypothetical protein